jgi:DMSO/TMAO reductase YedYZ molybdopterin-dependent catalytic subunit
VNETRIPIRELPYNAESTPSALERAITPDGAHYVRSNFAVPSIDAAQYTLQIDGAVRTSLTLTLADLATWPQHEQVVTMECAGNDRLGLRPVPPGEPWASGAVATARWRGVRLADVLSRAGIEATACELVATGADMGPRDDAAQPVRFARSLPIEVACHPDTLLATHMNDRPLAPEHGAPVRLIVPGWYGMANVKWVQHLTLVTTPFEGYFQRARYMYVSSQSPEPVMRARVKSMITSPREEARVPSGPLAVHGWAWSGDGAITQVDINVGGGDRWVRADVGEAAGPYAWAPFRAVITPPHTGRLVLASRATDASGAVQPNTPPWNALGYGNNAVRPIVVQVTAVEQSSAM